MAISQKIISGNDQPSGGGGIVGIAGANGLGNSGTLMTEINGTNIVSPFPPLQASKIDWSIATCNTKLNNRFDDTNYYHGSGSYGGPS
jgi:hypothetical protein|tara:strand:- start:31067 stop:31330 length:264 start_codon:yes stop_codon:yes gene_type:complete